MGSTLWPADPVAGQPSYTGRRLRQAMSAILAGATSVRPLGGRSGIRLGPTTNLLAATSTTWTLAAHAGIVDAELAAEAGPYWYSFDAAQTGAMTPAPSNPNSRIDIVWVRIDDPSESDGSTTPQQVAGYTAGVPAASNPAVPSPPAVTGGTARYIVIGQILVPFSGAPVVTITAPFTAAAGGRLPVRSQAERDALPLYNGLCVHRLDTGNIESYHNGWRTELDVGAWTAYAPTWTGATSGTGNLGTGGSLSGWSQKMGRKVDWQAVMVTGPDATFPTGDFQISLPYQAQIRGALTVVGGSLFIGGGNLHGDCVADAAVSGNKFRIAYHGAAGNANVAGGVGNPASWLGRTVAFWGRYEATS